MMTSWLRLIHSSVVLTAAAVVVRRRTATTCTYTVVCTQYLERNNTILVRAALMTTMTVIRKTTLSRTCADAEHAWFHKKSLCIFTWLCTRMWWAVPVKGLEMPYPLSTFRVEIGTPMIQIFFLLFHIASQSSSNLMFNGERLAILGLSVVPFTTAPRDDCSKWIVRFYFTHL